MRRRVVSFHDLTRLGEAMHSLRSLGLSSLGLALTLSACGSEASTPPTDPATGATETPTPTPTPEQNIPFGTIEGIVRLAEGATLPAFETNPMATDRPIADLPADCPPAQESDRQPVQVAANGGLTNLIIVATGDQDHWPHSGEPRTHTVRIEHCRLSPRVLVAERGDTVHLENSTTFPFFPDLGTGMTRALIPTDPIDVVLDTGGARAVECGFANPCGRLDIVTLYHPVHTVTNAEGTFRLTNVPAGQDVRINAWHPLFIEGHATARVEAGQTTHVELVISPPAPPPPAPSVNEEEQGEMIY